LNSIIPAVSNSSRKRARTKESIHFKKQKVKAYEQQHSYRVKHLSDNTFEIKDKSISLKKGKRIPAFGNEMKIVTFDFEAKQVSCTCPAWIGLQMGKSSDDVCKHVPIVIMKCDKMMAHLYYGNRNIIDYDIHNLKGILATFVEDRMIENPAEDSDNEQNRNKKRKTGSTETGALLTKQSMLKIKDIGPFLSKELALSHAPNNQWYGEFYKVGGNPSCRTCGKKITNENRLVIRTDVATAFQNPASKSKVFLLRSETVRFCLNTFCHKNLPVKNYRHIMKLASLNLAYLPAKY
jgi:hypothetical protein